MEARRKELTKAEFTDHLRENIRLTMKWHWMCARRYRDDYHGEYIAVLRKLEASLADFTTDSNWESVRAHLENDDRSNQWVQVETDMLRNIGETSISMNELVSAILAQFKPPSADVISSARALTATLRDRDAVLPKVM
jgi:hypothetical protein